VFGNVEHMTRPETGERAVLERQRVETTHDLDVVQRSADRTPGSAPETGREIAARTGRYGPYVTEVLPDGSAEKPRTASLFKSMSPESVTLEDALRLLTLPRTLGAGADGVDVVAQNGRYGPYVKRGTETRSLETEEQLLTVTLDEASTLLAQPKVRRGRAGSETTPRGPLREIGADPSSGKPLVVRDGRFGPYVTDGETNASLRRGGIGRNLHDAMR